MDGAYQMGFFLTEPEVNGKSPFINNVSDCLGDLCISISFTDLIASLNHNVFFAVNTFTIVEFVENEARILITKERYLLKMLLV